MGWIEQRADQIEVRQQRERYMEKAAGTGVFLKRRPSAFYGTGVTELLHMLRRDTIIIGQTPA
jgi:hypothetical protein